MNETTELPRTIRVLIVEDCDEDAELLVRALEKAGFAVEARRVETVETLRKALDHQTWHVVISDYSMPHLTGREALDVVRAVTPETPFLFFSGSIEPEEAVAAMHSGAADYVRKGDVARLIPAVRRELVQAESRKRRRVAEEALLKSEENLRHAQRMESLGQLAGGVAHDFNNLLTVIAGFTELAMAHPTVTGAPHDYLDQVRKAAHRAAELTRQLLAFSRRSIAEPRVVDLNQAAMEAVKLLRRLIGENIELELLSAPTPICIRADPGHVNQVIMNLAVNARDAMPNGGKLTIQVSLHDAPGDSEAPAEGRVRLTVADTGCGMDAETQKRIFEPFFTTKEPGKGTGLGLATVYGLVNQAGGAVRVDSAPGRGSRFHVVFPRVDSPGEEPVVRVAPAASARGSETVLLVEDAVPLREVARLALAAAGYRVIDANNGSEALEIVQRLNEPIHLLLTDMVMPQIGGRELARRVREKLPGVRVLYMSGYSDEFLDQGRIAQDKAAFLPKPYTPDGLVRKVREVLDGPPPAGSP